MQPLEALTYTGSDGNSGGSYALQTGEAFTFQLPQAFTPENYAYWEQLRTSGLAVRIPQPTADPIPLQMQRALVKVDIFSTASAAVWAFSDSCSKMLAIFSVSCLVFSAS